MWGRRGNGEKTSGMEGIWIYIFLYPWNTSILKFMLKRFLSVPIVALCKTANQRGQNWIWNSSGFIGWVLFSDLCPQNKVRNLIRLLRCLLEKVQKLHQFGFANQQKGVHVTLLLAQIQDPANAERIFCRRMIRGSKDCAAATAEGAKDKNRKRQFHQKQPKVFPAGDIKWSKPERIYFEQ